MSIHSMPPRFRAGDIIGAFLPLHIHRGHPGPELRLCLVLGLEVDEQKKAIEGVWVVRLSDRTDKVRSWDYYLTKQELGTVDGLHLNRDYVIRTPRIDLLPATPDFVPGGIFGYIKGTTWDGLRTQIKQGQDSHFADNSYGPRGKLPHTVVKTGLDQNNSFLEFDVESIISEISLPSMTPDICRSDTYSLARQEQNRQLTALSRQIHEDFRFALRHGKPWDFEEYRRTVLEVRRPAAAPTAP